MAGSNIVEVWILKYLGWGCKREVDRKCPTLIMSIPVSITSGSISLRATPVLMTESKTGSQKLELDLELLVEASVESRLREHRARPERKIKGALSACSSCRSQIMFVDHWLRARYS